MIAVFWQFVNRRVIDDVPIVTAVLHCGPRSAELVSCPDIYKPVCAQIQVECITTPCNPIPQTFENSCEACVNERVVSYQEGPCLSE